MNTEARSSLGVAQNKQKHTHKTCMHSAEIAWTLSPCPFGLVGGHEFQHLEDVPGDACAAPGELSLGGRSRALAWPCPSGEELASLFGSTLVFSCLACSPSPARFLRAGISSCHESSPKQL